MTYKYNKKLNVFIRHSKTVSDGGVDEDFLTAVISHLGKNI